MFDVKLFNFEFPYFKDFNNVRLTLWSVRTIYVGFIENLYIIFHPKWDRILIFFFPSVKYLRYDFILEVGLT